jgi:hypothetical protein
LNLISAIHAAFPVKLWTFFWVRYCEKNSTLKTGSFGDRIWEVIKRSEGYFWQKVLLPGYRLMNTSAVSLWHNWLNLYIS